MGIQDHRAIGLSLPAPNLHCPDHRVPVRPTGLNRLLLAIQALRHHLSRHLVQAGGLGLIDKVLLHASGGQVPRLSSSKLRIRTARRWLPCYRAVGNRWLHSW
jgi:hypothetical protein